MPDHPAHPSKSTDPPREFWCLRSDTAETAYLTAGGELDIAAVPELDSALRRAAVDASLVVLDLRALEFIDSSGAHLLVATNRRIRRGGGSFAVVRGPAEIDWFFELIGLDRELELVGRPPARRRSTAKLTAVRA